MLWSPRAALPGEVWLSGLRRTNPIASYQVAARCSMVASVCGPCYCWVWGGITWHCKHREGDLLLIYSSIHAPPLKRPDSPPVVRTTPHSLVASRVYVSTCAEVYGTCCLQFLLEQKVPCTVKDSAFFPCYGEYITDMWCVQMAGLSNFRHKLPPAPFSVFGSLAM